MVAWLPDSGNGHELLLVPMKGSYTVGLLYRVWVTRADGRVVVHGWPRYANRRVEPGLAALLRAEHYAAHARLALAQIKPRRSVASRWTRPSSRSAPSREG